MTFKIQFLNPEFFWLLLIVPIACIWFILKKNKFNNSISVPNTSALLSQPSVLPKLKPVLNILRILSLIFIIIALARPQIIDVTTKIKNNQGIDIVMAIDVSASMLAKDLKPNRLEALKNVASNFILDRTNDRIGLVEYAGESYTKTPITSDKNIIIKSLKEYKISAFSDRKNIGIWIKKRNSTKKIAAIGIRVKKWIAYHGFSLNINNDIEKYKKIIPCGIENKGVTNLRLVKDLNYKYLKKKIVKNLLKNL